MSHVVVVRERDGGPRARARRLQRDAHGALPARALPRPAFQQRPPPEVVRVPDQQYRNQIAHPMPLFILILKKGRQGAHTLVIKRI